MPPKYKPGGKHFPPKIIPKPVPQQVQPVELSSETSANNNSHPETENQFELELCWCIQQLELNMNSKKLGEKQMRDVQKSVKLLKSSNIPLIQKRQIMRTTFGDYRAKMAQEEKKHSKNAAKAKICAPKLSESKSIFFRIHEKKSAEVENQNLKEQINGENYQPKLADLFKQSQAEESFKFNFTTLNTN